MPSKPTVKDLAEAYGVSRKTIYSWKSKKVDVLVPRAVIDHVVFAARYDFDLIEKLKKNEPRVRELLRQFDN